MHGIDNFKFHGARIQRYGRDMMRVIFIALFFIAAAGCANADIAELGLEHLKGRLMRPSDSPAATPQLTSSLRKIAPGACRVVFKTGLA